MITRRRRRRYVLLAILAAICLAAGSMIFELEPSASEESQRGTELLGEEFSQPTEEESQVDPIEAGDSGEIIALQTVRLSNEIHANREVEYLAVSRARAEARGQLREAAEAAAESAETQESVTDPEQDGTVLPEESEENEWTDDWSDWDDEDEDDWSDWDDGDEDDWSDWDDEDEDDWSDWDDEDEDDWSDWDDEDEDDWSDGSDEDEDDWSEGDDEDEDDWSNEEDDEEDSEDSEDSESSSAESSQASGSYSDLDYLAAICQIEAGSNYEGALAVANVVLNRLHSGYASSVYGVIYAPYQFATGSMDYYLQNGTSANARQAAADALAGVNNVGSYLHFNGASWLDPDTLTVPYTVIGGNVFY